MAAGVAATRVRWGGGKGTVICHIPGSISSAEMQMECDGNWVDCKDINGTTISFTTTAAMFNFELPATFLRINGTVTGASVMAVGN